MSSINEHGSWRFVCVGLLCWQHFNIFKFGFSFSLQPSSVLGELVCSERGAEVSIWDTYLPLTHSRIGLESLIFLMCRLSLTRHSRVGDDGTRSKIWSESYNNLSFKDWGIYVTRALRQAKEIDISKYGCFFDHGVQCKQVLIARITDIISLTFGCAMRLSVWKKICCGNLRNILIRSLSGSQTHHDWSSKACCMTDDILLFHMELNSDTVWTQEP